MSHLGVDVSSYQQMVDWKQLRASGYEFAYVRCCDGHVIDTMQDTHTVRARAASLVTGSYQYGHPSMDVLQLADFFVQHAWFDQLRPVIDMEALAVGNIVPHNAGEWADAWCERVKASAGTEPIIYSSPSYYNQMVDQHTDVGGWDWWCAAYTQGVGVIATIPPRTKYAFVAWQNGGDVKLAGVVGQADVDVCDDLSVLMVK